MSTMPFSELEIVRYRGLSGVKLDGLGRVNLLVGLNNSGKTSVLEALSLCTAPLDPWAWIRTARRREPGRFPVRTDVERLRWLFPRTADESAGELYTGKIVLKPGGSGLIRHLEATYRELRGTPVEASAELDEAVEDEVEMISPGDEAAPIGRGARIEISVEPQGPFFESPRRRFTLWEGERFVFRERSGLAIPADTVTPYDHWFRILPARQFSEAKRGGLETEIVSLLHQLDDRITGVEVLAEPSTVPRLGSQAALYLRDRGAGLLPVEAFGDGFRRVLLMALAVQRAAGGVLFIDEIETAIHVSALAKVFGWMVAACQQRGVQLFLTTHSLEAIDAILAADTTPEEDIVAYRLERQGEETRAKRYGEDLLKRLRFERGLEVR
jgi:hypothetical protein